MNLSISENAEAAAAAAAAFLVGSARLALRFRSRCCIALSGGSTPKRLYRILVSRHRHSVDWQRLLFFLSDERYVPLDDPASNAGLAIESLIRPLGLPLDGIETVPTKDNRPERAAAAYQDAVVHHLGADPRFDLILLGLGEDGHTASLFPGTRALDEKDALVAANWVENASAWRITFTYPLLNRARRLLFLVTGRSKAERVRDILQDRRPDLPAARLDPDSPGISWFLDADAAYLIGGRV